MDIFDFMDCIGCPYVVHDPGCSAGDPDRCRPEEYRCRLNSPDEGPCYRMLGAIEDVINDGEFVTPFGQVCTAEYLTSDDGREDFAGRGIGEGVDFSSARYVFVPDGGNELVLYADALDVYRGLF